MEISISILGQAIWNVQDISWINKTSEFCRVECHIGRACIVFNDKKINWIICDCNDCPLLLKLCDFLNSNKIYPSEQMKKLQGPLKFGNIQAVYFGRINLYSILLNLNIEEIPKEYVRVVPDTSKHRPTETDDFS